MFHETPSVHHCPLGLMLSASLFRRLLLCPLLSVVPLLPTMPFAIRALVPPPLPSPFAAGHPLHCKCPCSFAKSCCPPMPTPLLIYRQSRCLPSPVTPASAVTGAVPSISAPSPSCLSHRLSRADGWSSRLVRRKRSSTVDSRLKANCPELPASSRPPAFLPTGRPALSASATGGPKPSASKPCPTVQLFRDICRLFRPAEPQRGPHMARCYPDLVAMPPATLVSGLQRDDSVIRLQQEVPAAPTQVHRPTP